jgi:hypothetical protein
MALSTLWGSRSGSVPLAWVIGVPGGQGVIVGRVVASGLLGLSAAAESAVVASPFVGIQVRRIIGVTSRSWRAAQSPTRDRAWTGQIERCSPRWSADCRRCCGGIAWSRRPRSCAGIVAWSPRSGLEPRRLLRSELGIDRHPPAPMTARPTEPTVSPHDHHATDLHDTQDLTFYRRDESARPDSRSSVSTSRAEPGLWISWMPPSWASSMMVGEDGR